MVWEVVLLILAPVTIYTVISLVGWQLVPEVIESVTHKISLIRYVLFVCFCYGSEHSHDSYKENQGFVLW